MTNPASSIPDDDGTPQIRQSGSVAPDPRQGLPQPGDLIGRYRLLRRIAHGNMGVVYAAEDTELQRHVALKILRNDLMITAEDRQRFRIESASMARLRHPGIVPVYEVGNHNGIEYFTMELIDGYGFDVWLRVRNRTFRERALIVEQIARSLQHAHEQGVLHRDLKPANVLIDGHAVARVTDFGLARTVDGDMKLTQPGRTVGTPAYMSPEQAQGMATDVRCDVWGIGAILYEALTGRTPFVGESTYVVMTAVVSEPSTPPRRFDRTVPRELEAITMQCLEKDPTRRYNSAQDLADDLGRWLAGEPVHARHLGPLQHLSLRMRKYRVSLLFALATVLVASAFMVYWQLERRRAHADWITLYHADCTAVMPAGMEFWDGELSSQVPSWECDANGLHMRPVQWLWLKDIHVSGDVRLSVTVQMDQPDGLEMCVSSRLERLPFTYYVPTGYSSQFAGYSGSVDMISRNAAPRLTDINTTVDSAIKGSGPQVVVLEHRGERLELRVNGVVSTFDEDPLPLTGRELDRIGLRTFSSSARLLSISVERLALPEKASPLIAGDALVQAGDFSDAVGSYLSTARDHPGGAIAELALTKAYFATLRAPDSEHSLAATIRRQLDQTFPDSHYHPRLLELDVLNDWQQADYGAALAVLPRIFAADPKTRCAIRLLSSPHPHLTADQGTALVQYVGKTTAVRELDLSQLALTSLEGLQPLRPRSLNCADNLITSLEPLRGQPLHGLTCYLNHIQDLSPVVGMPLTNLDVAFNPLSSIDALAGCTTLTKLRINHCGGVSSLEALADKPLTALSASGDPITSLSPLLKDPLQELELEGCQVSDLTPIAGKRLTMLNLACNRISDLSPLAHCHLGILELSMNQVADLSPLRGCTLDHLGLDHNQVQDLTPLAQASIKRLDCSDNQISDLTPLMGLHLNYLECANNPLTSLQPLLSDPPGVFLFDGGTFPLPEISRVAAVWHQDGRHEAQAHDCDVLLAARQGDTAKLHSYALRFHDRLYLLVPMAVTWDDASARCLALGGRLACIHDQMELGQIAKLLGSNGAWIGLRIKAADSSWSDGTPLSFNVLPANDIGLFQGPIRMDNSATQAMWFARDYLSQRMPFLVEWDIPHP